MPPDISNLLRRLILHQWLASCCMSIISVMISVTFVYTLSRKDVESIRQEIQHLHLFVKPTTPSLSVGKSNALDTPPVSSNLVFFDDWKRTRHTPAD